MSKLPQNNNKYLINSYFSDIGELPDYELNCIKYDTEKLNAIKFKNLFKQLKISTNFNQLKLSMLKLLRYYDRNKEYIPKYITRRIMRRELPMFCLQQQVADSELVCYILQIIGDMERETPSSVAVFLLSTTNFQFPLCNTTSFTWTSTTFLTYFLDHAQKMKLSISGKRLPEHLLTVQPDSLITTVLYSNPETVLTILQYGSRSTIYESGNNVSETSLIALALEFIIYCRLRNDLWDELGNVKVPVENFSSYMIRMLTNFRYILRTIANPQYFTFRLAGIDLGGNKVPIMDVPKLWNFLNALNPDLELVVAKAPSLKRICRAILRKILFENWQLPNGIHHLNMPDVLRDYVNLMSD